MKTIKKMLRVLAVTFLLLFSVLFIYANWHKPTLGERIYMENPTQIVVMRLPDNFSARDSLGVLAFFDAQEGVYSNIVRPSAHTLCVTIDPRKTDRSSILEKGMSFHPGIVEREPLQARAECPVNLGPFRKLTYALNIRK
jgi:hypothetical protein